MAITRSWCRGSIGLELAEFLATWGEPDHINHDLEELFTRVVFNVATANRDDHLRNHGFMRTPAGWRLAPAFDMNPSFKKNEHALAGRLDNFFAGEASL